MSSYASAFTGLPFVAGDVRGIRSWDVDQLGRLISPTYKTVWTPGENGAECKKRDDEMYYSSASGFLPRLTFQYIDDTYRQFASGGRIVSAHTPPAPAPVPVKRFGKSISTDAVEAEVPEHSQEKCACGFYAYSNGMNEYAAPSRLTGVIQGYGETQLGTRGFKCEKATVLALHIPEKPMKVRKNVVTTHSNHFERVKANYPGVAIFAKYADMLVAFPTYQHVPTPDSDADFWSRPIQGA